MMSIWKYIDKGKFVKFAGAIEVECIIPEMSKSCEAGIARYRHLQSLDASTTAPGAQVSIEEM